MTALEQYITSYFGVVRINDLNTIVSLFKLVTLKKGDYLVKSGMRCDKLCFVESGLLRTFATTQSKEVTQWISKAGYFSADISSFIFENPSRWSIQALTDVKIYAISRNDYKKIGNLVSQWNEFEKLFTIKCFAILEDRIFSHLSMSAEERYKNYFEQNKELFNQVPLQYIASMLGMTPETFSRIRKKQLQ